MNTEHILRVWIQAARNNPLPNPRYPNYRFRLWNRLISVKFENLAVNYLLSCACQVKIWRVSAFGLRVLHEFALVHNNSTQWPLFRSRTSADMNVITQLLHIFCNTLD